MKFSHKALLLGSAVFFVTACSSTQPAQAQPGGSAQIIQPVTKNHCALFKEDNQNYLYDNGPCPGGGGGGGGVSSFNSRTGDITLLLADVINALTFTPANQIRNLTANNGITGGGNLSADRTFGLASIAADNVLMNSTGSSAPPIATAITNCSASGNALNYSTSSHAFSCRTSLGSVTSVASTFTGGIISISGSPITASGTLGFTVTGTSGGIPYFSGTNSWATTGVLSANAPVIGGGAGVAPSTGTVQGNTTKFLSVAGSFTSGNGLVSDGNGNASDIGYVTAAVGTGAILTSSPSAPSSADFNQSCKQFTINAGSINIPLPAASGLGLGGCIDIINATSSTYTLTPNGSDNLNGANTALTEQGGTLVRVTSNGTSMFANQPASGGGGLANPITVAVSDTYTGAASTAAFLFSGTPFNGGTGTTTFPQFFLQPTGVTAATDWNTGGTGIGVNLSATNTPDLMVLKQAGTTRFSVDGGGHVRGAADFATLNPSGDFQIGTKTQWSAPNDGNFLIQDNGGTGNVNIQFGGTAATFPELLRSTTEIQVKLADGSLFSNLGLSAIVHRGATPTLTGTCTSGTKVGGQTGGTFVATCTAQTVIVTFLTTAPNGWNCKFWDRTTPADIINQASSTATSCTTAASTTAASDVISWSAEPY